MPGVWTVHRLTWPYDADGYRDIAAAQAIRDGRWTDPFYKDEAAWYSPAVPAIVAATAAIVDAPVSRTFVVLGPWLNALAPIGFYLCALRLTGALPALAAVTAYLFLPGRAPAWAAATFSPWLFPAISAHTLFYLGVMVCVALQDRLHAGKAALAGAIVGVGVLWHPASALTLAGVLLATHVPRVWSPAPHGYLTLRLLLVLGVVAGLTSAPAWVPIAWRYGFHTLNRAPAVWVYEAVQPWALLEAFVRPSALVISTVAAVGVWQLWRHGDRRAAGVVLAWVGVAGGFFVYMLAAERTPALPPLVSAYHFYFQLVAAKWLLFGVGLVSLGGALLAFIARADRRVQAWPPAAVVVVPILLCVAVYPRYLRREAFTHARALAEQASTATQTNAAREWIRRYAPADAVFLTSDDDALRVVGPAGRRVVCVFQPMSNPYVSYEARAAARDRMFAALARADPAQFRSDARRYGVTHVFLPSSHLIAIAPSLGTWTRVAFANQMHAILEVAK